MPSNFRRNAKNFKRTFKRPIKKDRIKKLVDGRPPSRLENIARNYIGPMGTIAKTVAGIVSMINTEHKMINVTSSGAVGSSGSVTLLSGLAQGTGDNDRIGNSLLYQDQLFNMIIAANSAAATSFLRIVLFVDKELDGALPSVADVIGPTPTVYNPLNEDFTKRFVILKNKLFKFNLNGNQVGTLKIFHKLPFHSYYDGTGATVADCKENQICLLMISDQVTNTPNVSYYSRIKYTDN